MTPIPKSEAAFLGLRPFTLTFNLATESGLLKTMFETIKANHPEAKIVKCAPGKVYIAVKAPAVTCGDHGESPKAIRGNYPTPLATVGRA